MGEHENGKCPRCGEPVPADATKGLCPRCLGALNLDPDTTIAGQEPPVEPAPTPRADSTPGWSVPLPGPWARFPSKGRVLLISLLALLLVCAILLSVRLAREAAAFRAAASASTQFHARVFEADAELVDQLIPTSQRKPGVQPGTAFYESASDHSTALSVGGFTVSRHGGAVTESQLALITLSELRALLNGIHPVPGLLEDRPRSVSGEWWRGGMPAVWSYSISRVDENLQGDGLGTVLLGFRRRGDKDEIHIEANLSHSIDFIKHVPGNVLESRILYEGTAPVEGALAFLTPFFQSDGSAHYLVVAYQVGNQPTPSAP